MGVKVPGPDPSDDLHATPFGFVKRWLGWTQEIDWAKQLTDALQTPQAIIAATKTLPGILRLATAAEAAAATNDSAALTPLQALALNRANPVAFANLASLFASNLPEGTIAVVGRYSYSSGILHRGSTWHRDAGAWTPVGGLIFVEASDRPGAVLAATSIVNDVSASSSAAFIPPGVRALNVVNGFEQTMVNGAFAALGLSTDWSFGSNNSVAYTNWDTNNQFATEVRRMPGGYAHVELAVKHADNSAWATGESPIKFGPSLRPSNPPTAGRTVTVSTYGSNGWLQGSVALAPRYDGNLQINAVPANTQGIFGSFVFPIAGI